jgi:hypothetical protein
MPANSGMLADERQPVAMMQWVPVTRSPSPTSSLKKLNRDASDRTLCTDAYRTTRAQNVRPGSFWSFAALLDQ